MSFRRVFVVMAAVLAVAVLATPFATAAPLSCDSDLNSFVTPGKIVSTTSKYAIEKTDPDQPLPDEATLDFLLFQALDIITQQARNLTDAPSVNGAFIQSQVAGSTWEVTGDAVCVDEGAYGGAVVIYAPVVSTENDSFVGFLPEGIHWKNATPQQFLPGDLNQLSAGNDVVIKRLSFYLLEPTVLNPGLHLPNQDIRPKPGRPTLPDQPLGAVIPVPACDGGAPTYLDAGDEAQSLWRIDADPTTNADFAMVQTVGNSLAVLLEMPFSDAPEGSPFDFLTSYLSVMAYAQNPYPIIKPGGHVEIEGGPFCAKFSGISATDPNTGEPVDMGWLGLGHMLNPDSDYSNLDINITKTSETATFWKVKATVQNTILSGWVLESVQRKTEIFKFDTEAWDVGDKISEGNPASYYWLSPLDLGTDEGAAYMAGWQLNSDIEIGEPSMYSPRDPFDLRGTLPPAGCEEILPMRVTPWGGARVIVPVSNVRSGPGLNDSPILGMAEGSLFRVQTSVFCADGYRWIYMLLTNDNVNETYYSGWVAEANSNTYFVEPFDGVEGFGRLIRPAQATATPPATATQQTFSAAPTQAPTKPPKPTATPTDPEPG